MMPGHDEQVLDRLKAIEDSIGELRTAIKGNPSMGHTGVVPRLEAAEVEIQKVEKSARDGRHEIHGRIDHLWGEWTKAKFIITGIVIGLSLVGGAGGTALYNALFAAG